LVFPSTQSSPRQQPAQLPGPQPAGLASGVGGLEESEQPASRSNTSSLAVPLSCIGRLRDVKNDAEVTYSNQIARIFQQHCVECHREGRIGPFVMTSYDDLAGWGEMIREVVQENRSPPGMPIRLTVSFPMRPA